MSGLVIKLLFSLFEKLATELVFQQTAAAVLENIVKSTKTKVDDELLGPAITQLRK